MNRYVFICRFTAALGIAFAFTASTAFADPTVCSTSSNSHNQCRGRGVGDRCFHFDGERMEEGVCKRHKNFQYPVPCDYPQID
ncbi:MAG: hypothetical protein KDD44_11105, partial [Bdellovibrionales bacterium]|nr:hypothetical protein [Bdellovibrionales bacterium]